MRLRSFCRIWMACKWPLALVVLSMPCFVDGQVLYQEQEIQVHDLLRITTKSTDPHEVLRASLETMLHDKEICCGKDSALEDSLTAADPSSLKDVAAKIDGRHLLSDGRAVQIKSQYFPAELIKGATLIQLVQDQHASVIQWNGRLYVVHGVVFYWESDRNGGDTTVLRKLLLWDLRYDDSRREVVYTRGVDDLGKVEGLLFAQISN